MESITDTVYECGYKAWMYIEQNCEDYGITRSVLFAFLLGMMCSGVLFIIWMYHSKNKRKSNLPFGTGKIHYDRSHLVGESSRARVCRGTFENIEVAVKEIKFSSIENKEEYQRELNMLKDLTTKRLKREGDIHTITTLKNDYIVHYHGQELYDHGNNRFLLFALELCHGNLNDVVENIDDFKKLTNRMILQQLSNGLNFLHKSGIAHRDIKPKNILVKRYEHPTSSRMKLADFGVSKFTKERDCFSISAEFGTDGWIAPEVIKTMDVANAKGYISSDIFSLGLVFFFVESSGKMKYRTQDDIQNNKPSEFEVDKKLESDLIEKMLHRDPIQRLSATDVLKHPALWTTEEILDFAATVSEFLKSNSNAINAILHLNDPDHGCFPSNWKGSLTPALLKAIGQRTGGSRKLAKYDFRSVKDLIRVIRNHGAHYHSLSKVIKTEFGSYPEGYIKYWMDRFPNLMLYTYNKMKKFQSESELNKFYN